MIRAGALFALGLIANMEHTPEKAVEWISEAASVYRDLSKKDPRSFNPIILNTLSYLRGIYAILQLRDQLKSVCEEEITVAQEILRNFATVEGTNSFNRVLRASAMAEQGKAQFLKGDFGKAILAITNAIQSFSALDRDNAAGLGFKPKLCDAYHDLAESYAGRKEIEKATDALLSEIRVYRSMTNFNRAAFLPSFAMVLGNNGRRLLEWKRYTEAMKVFQEVVAAYQELADTDPKTNVPLVAAAYGDLATAYWGQGKKAEARDNLNQALKRFQQAAKTQPELYEPSVRWVQNNLNALK